MRSGLKLAIVVGLAASCSPDPVDVSVPPKSSVPSSTTISVSAAASPSPTTPGPATSPSTTRLEQPITSTSVEPFDGPVAFVERLLDQTTQWHRGVLGGCTSFELHEQSDGAGIVSAHYGAGRCGGETVTAHRRYDGDVLVEEVGYIEWFTDENADAMTLFERVNAEVQALPTVCIDVPSNRLLPSDRWNGSCPESDPIDDERDIVARVLQQAELDAEWTDWCVDVFIDRMGLRDGVISVAPAIAFGCDPALQPRQFVYENFRLVERRTSRPTATTLGMCLALEQSADWPSVGPEGCRADVVVPHPEWGVGEATTDRLSSARLGPRLAYSDGTRMWLRSRGAPSVLLGFGTHPGWSLDGRYLSWIRSDGRQSMIYVLDTTDGERDAAEVEGGLYHQPVPLLNGFAALTGNTEPTAGSTSFYWYTPSDIRWGHGPALQAAHLVSNHIEAIGVGSWASDGRVLYVGIEDASGTWYRGFGELVTVDVFGNSTYRFADCGDDEMCESNIGLSGLSVSPDGRHVFYDGGLRNGCVVGSREVLTPSDRYAPIPLRWQGSDGEQGWSRLWSVSWISADEFLVVAELTDRAGFEECEPPLAQPREVLRCGIDGTCRSTGIEASDVAAGPGGEIAVVNRAPYNWDPAPGRVYWPDGSSTWLAAVDHSSMAWSPAN